MNEVAAPMLDCLNLVLTREIIPPCETLTKIARSHNVSQTQIPILDDLNRKRQSFATLSVKPYKLIL